MFRKWYDIGESTISNTKKQEPALHVYKTKMTGMEVGWSTKIMKLGRDEELEAALFCRSSRSERREYRSLDQLCKQRVESSTSG